MSLNKICFAQCYESVTRPDLLGTCASSLTVRWWCWPHPRTLWSLSQGCVARTPGTICVMGLNKLHRLWTELGRKHFSRPCAIFKSFMIFNFHRMDSIMFGHYRLSQDTDNQTKVYVVVSKRKEEVGLPVQVYGPFSFTVLFYLFVLLLAVVIFQQKVVEYQRSRFCRRNPAPEAERAFHVGLQLSSGGRQRFNKLVWIHHSCHITYRYLTNLHSPTHLMSPNEIVSHAAQKS